MEPCDCPGLVALCWVPCSVHPAQSDVWSYSLISVVVQSLSESDSLRPHGLQHTRLPCPSLSPGVCSNSCPLSQWCHSTISSSIAPFSSCPHCFPASGSLPHRLCPLFILAAWSQHPLWWQTQQLRLLWVVSVELKFSQAISSHLMQRANSLKKTVMLGKIEGRRKRGWQRVRWLRGITDSMDISLSKF